MDGFQLHEGDREDSQAGDPVEGRCQLYASNASYC